MNGDSWYSIPKKFLLIPEFIFSTFASKLNCKSNSKDVDRYIPSLLYSGTTELEQRLAAKQCESCNKTEQPFYVHHVRRVKDLKNKKGKNWLEWIHITRQRRTVILCKECHLKYHHGDFRHG
ncbi:hypothetical protein [Candidatus Uabimicrobium sp. HlEnr_7]|uniref:HNH endonuclease n=1 Tax=Candidatus Uabimicrobium helgolandensis TaxID=3095367 RepID=UPI0035588266